LNFAKATYNALNQVNIIRLPLYYGKEEV
ncbi:MAG: 30S ribosomal protein S5, partial [Methanosarcina sp.]|nr:30S ribosomal protein S5 [Methanosarcina sp.]